MVNDVAATCAATIGAVPKVSAVLHVSLRSDPFEEFGVIVIVLCVVTAVVLTVQVPPLAKTSQ